MVLDTLPPVDNGRHGQWCDHRQAIGIVHRVRTGARWRDLPERYGLWMAVYERHRRWSADGTWVRLLEQAQTGANAAGRIDGDGAVDSRSIRAHLCRPDSVGADLAYYNRQASPYLRRGAIRDVVPEKRDTIERAIDKIKDYRAAAT